MSVITISRQYGSGGDEIAARVCEILDYRYFDQRLMSQVAVKAGLSEDEAIDFSEAEYKSQSFLGNLLDLLTRPAGEAPAVAQVSTWSQGCLRSTGKEGGGSGSGAQCRHHCTDHPRCLKAR